MKWNFVFYNFTSQCLFNGGTRKLQITILVRDIENSEIFKLNYTEESTLIFLVQMKIYTVNICGYNEQFMSVPRVSYIRV
jgi:hypothetical protein